MPRPRKPTALMERNGAFDRNPTRRRIDPATSGQLGNPPKSLSEPVSKLWKELKRNLPEDVARNADRASFEVLCTLMYRFRCSSFPKSNPDWIDFKGAELGNLTSLLARFGLTPSDRAKVAAPASSKKDDSNPFTEFVS